jgi:hypothetical protein
MPNISKNVSGQKFDMLLAVEIIGKRGKANLWKCICDCGSETFAIVSQLTRGDRTSCGCKKKQKKSPRPDLILRNKQNAKHAMSKSHTYKSWKSMKSRCYDKNDKDYPRWGGRGITVCDSWKNSFIEFYKDMGDRPNGHTIDRIDNNGNYELKNCRWAVPKVQSNNTRKNYYIEYMGKTQTAKQWAEELKTVEYKTILYRLRNGWETHAALTTPSTIKRK